MLRRIHGVDKNGYVKIIDQIERPWGDISQKMVLKWDKYYRNIRAQIKRI